MEFSIDCSIAVLRLRHRDEDLFFRILQSTDVSVYARKMPCVQSKPVEFCAESQDDEPCKGSVLRWLFGQCVRDGTLKRLVGGAVALSVCSLCNLVTPHILGAVVDASQPNWRPSGIAKLAGVSSLRQLLFVAGCIFALGAVASAVRTEQLERAQEEVFFRLR